MLAHATASADSSISAAAPAPEGGPAFKYFDLTRTVRLSDLSSTDRHILTVFLAYLDGKNGTFCPGQARVARETGFVLRTVELRVAWLVHHGWLVPLGVSRYGTTVYRLGRRGTPPPDRGSKTPDRGSEFFDPRSAYLHQKEELHPVGLHPDARAPEAAAPTEPSLSPKPEHTQLVGSKVDGNPHPTPVEQPADPKAAEAAALITTRMLASPHLRPAADPELAARIARELNLGRRIPLSLVSLALEQLACKIADSGEPWPVAKIRQSVRTFIVRAKPASGRWSREDEDPRPRKTSAPGLAKTAPPAAPDVPETTASRACGGRAVLAALRQASAA